jgi:hypothetical protein
MGWPGEAAVSVSVVHLAKGAVCPIIFSSVRLDGFSAASIDSFLEARCERPKANTLTANNDLVFAGANIQGSGFLINADERARLVEEDRSCAQLILPFLGGDDLNSNPNQMDVRFAINFGEMTLAEARFWPSLLSIVEERVRPARERLRDDQATARQAKANWWLFWAPRTEKFRRVRQLPRCLVTARVTKHLCFSFRSCDSLFNDMVCVFIAHEDSTFAVLQSRCHEAWARLMSSSLEDRLRYSGSDCFETFPFPQPDPRAVIPTLEEIGERLYTKRATYMVDTQQGLTQTYNALKDPRVNEARVVELRRLHEEMDRAVLAAYGWDDLAVPPYGTPTSDAEKKALERFEDEVIDRLFALNAKRAEEERAAAEREAATKPAKAKTARKKKGDEGGGQGDLGIG